jgi:hypothetical protein
MQTHEGSNMYLRRISTQYVKGNIKGGWGKDPVTKLITLSKLS